MEEQLGLVKYEKLSTKEKVILYFLVYAFLGWCLETIYAYMVYGYFVKRGFLYGPICPIYGFGAILLILILNNIKEGNNITKFLVSMLSFSIFEYMASFILETIFHQRWWDYTGAFLNIQGRICITFSLLWGIAGVLFINYIHPYIKKKLNKMSMQVPVKVKRIVIYLLGSMVIIDEIFSILKYIG